MDDPLQAAFWIRLGVAIGCGAAIGLERQIRGKPAGIRTSILICLGTVMFLRVGATLGGSVDPSRVLGQLITGIGFLGGGVILSGGTTVRGVTSAAVIWVLAAIGAAVGQDLHAMAVALTAVTLAVLVGVERLEKLFAALRRGVHQHDENA